MQVWVKEKLFLKSQLKKHFKDLQKKFNYSSKEKLQKYFFGTSSFPCSGSFYPSPFENAVILCMDELENGQQHLHGLEKKKLNPLWEINFLILGIALFCFYLLLWIQSELENIN